MCDLWMYTTADDSPRSAIPAQIAAARTVLHDQPITGMKLYNAGSFFDPRAVPETDYDAIAAALGGFSRVIVESHPALVGVRVDRFRAALDRHSPGSLSPAALEVAMGLETAHPQALDALNKRFTPGDFAAAARALNSVASRCGYFSSFRRPSFRLTARTSGFGIRSTPRSPARRRSSLFCRREPETARWRRWGQPGCFDRPASTISNAASRWRWTMPQDAGGCSWISGTSTGSRPVSAALPRVARVSKR
jgi:hypothetical protein